VIVPPEPGNFSALGMLLADPRLDTAQTMVVRLSPESLARVTALYGELETQGREALRREFGEGSVSIEREAEMRYKGQHHSIKIAIGPQDDAAALRERFDREYLRRYGHTNPADVEIVVLHSLATLHMSRPELQRLAKPSAGREKRAELEVRPVFFLDEDRFLPTQVYDRAALGTAFAGKGPALIVEYGSSTLVGPRDTFTIGRIGEIEIDCHA
jgi:N-methylhydantoinase A